MTQIATVKRLMGDQAEVLVRRQSACGHDCGHCAGCGLERAPEVSAAADNALGACPGDTVLVESESAQVLGLAAALYLAPLALLFVGYFAASLALGLGESSSMAVGLLCLAAGVAANFLVDRRLRARRPVRYRIVEVLKPCSGM